MADQLKEGDSYVSNNSIHHSMQVLLQPLKITFSFFQRCVTCHGSFGCLVEDNVAYEHLGHCYFIEDGVEKDTVLRGNLGLGTRRTLSSNITSDRDPATFWITHPAALVIGNSAAGSEGKGFWFLQARLPVGESGRRQAAGNFTYFEEGELFRTALTGISGNTVIRRSSFVLIHKTYLLVLIFVDTVLFSRHILLPLASSLTKSYNQTKELGSPGTLSQGKTQRIQGHQRCGVR